MIDPPAVVMTLPEAAAEDENARASLLSLLPKQRTCTQSDSSEIVVCGRRNENRYRVGPPVPEDPNLMEEVAKGFTIGPVRITPGKSENWRAGASGVQFTIPF